jgi:hypothetical protein
MTRPVVQHAHNAVIAVGLLIGAACGGRRATPAAAPVAPSAPAVTDGASLVSAMRFKHAQWYRTLSFTANVSLFSTRGSETPGQWRQQISVPGKLRIDYLPLSGRSGVLFDGARVHTFDNGRAIDAQPGVNPQLVVTADVYTLAPDRATKLLDSLGFDLTKLRRDTWEGQPVYVVGAAAGDTTTSQVWVDSDRFVAVRMIQKERRGTRDIVTDVRLGKFTDVGGFPIATEVLQYRDGRLIYRERRVDVRVNEPIPDATFDPARWGK